MNGNDDGPVPVVTDAGRPALAFRGGGSGGRWGAILAQPNWSTYRLTSYLRRGALVFEARGERGGERFTLALRDKVAGRSKDATTTGPRLSANWRRYEVPLARWAAGKIDGDQVWNLVIGGGPTDRFLLRNVRFESPDREPSAPLLKTNAVGYRIGAPMIALVSDFPDALVAKPGDPFRLVGPGGRRFDGKLTLRADVDRRTSGDRVLVADFSGLTAPGSWTLRAGGAERRIVVGRDPYARLLRDACRYYYYQRSGVPLLAKHAGRWARGEGHPQDRRLRFDPPNGRTIDAHGGWYDAGDYGRYVGMAVQPLSDLFWAYELAPARFRTLDLNIPESGDGVPDLLNECRWQLEWILRMRDAKTGGFHHMVWPQNSDRRPDDDPMERWVTAVEPTHDAAMAAGILARASWIYRPYDRAFANRCLIAARGAWFYLEKHPKPVVATGMIGATENDLPARGYALGELYRATGEARFLNGLLKDHRRPKEWRSKHDNAWGGDFAMLGWIAAAHPPRVGALPGPPRTVAERVARAWLKEQYGAWRATQIARNRALPWRNYLEDEDYYWGSSTVALQTVGFMALGDRATGRRPDAESRAGAQSTLDYVLGTNPLGVCYVTGQAPNSVRRTYSLQWSKIGRGVPPGYLPGGPNRYDARSLSRFSARCFVDSDGEWTTNENAIYYTSPLILALSSLR